MTTKQPNPPRHGPWALSTLLLLSVAACSSKERSDLVLVDVDLTEVPSARSLSMALLSATAETELRQQLVTTPPLQNGIAKIGLAQTAGMTGDLVVRVIALDDAGAILGQGISLPVTLVPGKNAGPVAVKVTKTDIVLDGSSPLPEPLDAGTQDAMGPDTATPLDAQAVNPETGPEAGSDTQPSRPDGIEASDGRLDAAPDAPADAPADAPEDLPPTEVGTIMSTINSCKKYVHYPDSPADCAPGSSQENVIVSSIALTPDAKYLVSAANNSWVKLWKVVDSGLEDTGLVFVGEDYKINATISPAGDVLAMVNPSGNVVLYDLKAAINQGIESQVGKLEASKLAARVGYYSNSAFYTTDGKQLVVLYPTLDSLNGDKTIVAVWEPVTGTLVREFDFDYPVLPLTVAHAPSTGPLWVVTAMSETVADDGGSHEQTTLTLTDASGATTGKVSFVIRGSAERAAFSADNRTLAIGTYEGEVSLWDLSKLGNIQRLGSPLVEPDKNDTVFALAFSSGDRFLASGSWIFNGVSSLRVIDLQSRTVAKRNSEYEPRSFAFASDGTTWAYGLGGCGFIYFCKN